jgi:GT2 family glycosyltransferase
VCFWEETDPVVVKDLVSVVILNWNCRQYIEECLDAVMGQTYESLEVIFVDNGSTDGSVEFVKQKYPALHVFENEMNLGFAAGMNTGIRRTKGEFVLPLNIDVFLRDDFIERAITRGMKRDQKIGMVGGKVFRYHGGKTADLADVGKYLVKRMTMKNSRNSEHEEYVFGPNGSCPVYRRAMLEDIKLSEGQFYDEMYFAFAEDLDLHWRAQLYGWQCIYLPDMISWHVHSASVGNQIRLIDKPYVFQKMVLRNRHMNIIKNLPADLFVRYLGLLVSTEFLTVFYFLFQRPRNAGAVFAAYGETLRAFPMAIEKRRFIQKNRRVSSRYIRSLFKGF